MIRQEDIPTHITLMRTQDELAPLQRDVHLARLIQEEQFSTSDKEKAHLCRLINIEEAMKELQTRIDYTLQCMDDLDVDSEYEYRIGIYYPEFCDQPYLRDRDEWIQAESAPEALKIWLEGHKHWIHPTERKMVKVMETRRKAE